MAIRSDQSGEDSRREREEMFTISPEILATGALPRKHDGSPYRAQLNEIDENPGGAGTV